jgi:SagB-type dehydrogenase family enzyme
MSYPRWAPITTVASDKNERVEIDSPVARSRVKLHRDALARLILGSPRPESLDRALIDRGLLIATTDEQREEIDWPTSDAIAHWNKRGWGLSLSYFLWSRWVEFIDSGPDARSRRLNSLREMVAAESCPSPPYVPGEGIPLLESSSGAMLSLGSALEGRKSVGLPAGGPVSMSELSTLIIDGTKKLRYCRAITDRDGPDSRLLVSVGSALDIYVVIFQSDDGRPGAYLFDPVDCMLKPMRHGDLKDEAWAALLGQPDPRRASALIVFVADFSRYQWRYRHERAMRNLWVEAGRLMQPLILAATAMGMQTGITPALADELFPSLLNRPAGNWQALHSLVIARP